MDNLILFGFKGCGKSYFGPLLAQTLTVPFFDLDERLEHLYKKNRGQSLSCRGIYLFEGEKAFREFESRALLSLQREKRSILSLGGGTPLLPYNLSLLQKMGRMIYLEAEVETLKKRALDHPPAFMAPRTFEEVYAERKSFYEKIPAHRVPISGRSDEQVIDSLVRIWHGE